MVSFIFSFFFRFTPPTSPPPPASHTSSFSSLFLFFLPPPSLSLSSCRLLIQCFTLLHFKAKWTQTMPSRLYTQNKADYIKLHDILFHTPVFHSSSLLIFLWRFPPYASVSFHFCLHSDGAVFFSLSLLIVNSPTAKLCRPEWEKNEKGTSTMSKRFCSLYSFFNVTIFKLNNVKSKL